MAFENILFAPRTGEPSANNPAGEFSFEHEHERLSAMLTTLHDALEKRSKVVELRPAVTSLKEYAELHFQHEEMAMRTAKYPLVDLHVIQHAALRRFISQLEVCVDHGFGESAKYGIAVIQHWIEDHLEAEDSDFFEFLRSEASDPAESVRDSDSAALAARG